MTETSSSSPVQSTPDEQTMGVTHPKKTRKWRGAWREFRTAFTRKEPSDEDEKHHALYQTYEHWAASVKITIQMLIGIILGIALLLQVIAFIFSFWHNPFFTFLTSHNPLYIIAFGLFFSTGVDLAYMLFTPGPDEAIDPVMTGLAAAILLGVGQLDFSKIQLGQGVALFLAAGALAGLFATKKYLFHPFKENRNGAKNQTQLAKQENEIAE